MSKQYVTVYIIMVILQVKLENIGNHDVVDGNPNITLALIWTINSGMYK